MPFAAPFLPPIALAAALALLAPTARAADAPVTMPSRDVDILYRLGAPASANPLRERVRWNIARGLQRIDPPTPGLHLILDYRARRVVSVRDAERLALVIENTAMPVADGSAGYVRRGDDVVAGLPCTDWETSDVRAAPSLVCYTPDGVTLRLEQAGRVVIQAISVSYAAADPAAFLVPADFKWIAPAPGSLAKETTP